MKEILIPIVQSFFDPATNTVSYVVSDPETKKAAIIDSVLDYDPASGTISSESAERIITYLQTEQLTVEWILETHAHADHLSAAPYLQEKVGGKIAIGEHIHTVQEFFGKIFNEGTQYERSSSDFDHLWKDDETFTVGNITARVIYTPGHTPADVSYLIGNALFVGDTLFMPDYGSARCDFPGGNAETLYQSVHKLYQLPDDTRLFLCHDYLPADRTEYYWETTIGEQKKGNVHLAETISQENFVRMRTERDKTLGMPTLIIPAIQTNIHAGRLPAQESNGISYLKIPLNSVFAKKTR